MAESTTLPADAPEVPGEPDTPAAVREGLVTAAEIERALGQTVSAALDLGRWDEGGGVEGLLGRLPRAVVTAVREGGRLRAAIRGRVLRALPEFPDAPPGAGVYRAADHFLASARRHVLLNGAITAAQGACAGHDTLAATLVSVGVCLARYDGALCSWRTSFLRHDYDCRHADTVQGLRDLLDRRAERGGGGSGFAAGRDRLSGLLRRGFMAAAERKALRERAASAWRMGHGVPAPLELLTGSGCMELIDEALPVLQGLLLDDSHWVFLPDALGSRALTTLADALEPGEFGIVQKGKPALEAMVECGTYAAGYKRRVQAFAARLGEASVLGGFRATRFAPARLFVAHAERAAEAAVIALADAALQPHRGHPLLLDLAALGAQAGLGVEAFRGVIESAYARAGATGLLADAPPEHP